MGTAILSLVQRRRVTQPPQPEVEVLDTGYDALEEAKSCRLFCEDILARAIERSHGPLRAVR